MREFGRKQKMEDVERSFWIILSMLDSTHQSLADAAKKLGKDMWRKNLVDIRNRDELLNYMWKARNSEVHDALVKWRPTMRHISLRITDPAKAQKIAAFRFSSTNPRGAMLSFLYSGKMGDDLLKALANDPIPPLEKQLAAGVEVDEDLYTLALDDFKIGQGRKAETVLAPKSHLGNNVSPSADGAVSLAITFYRGKYDELIGVA
jgi:hypothetical protein